VILVIGLQLTLLVRAYHAPLAIYGYQMFPESSEWQAEIVRVTSDGERIDITAEWPGGYRWGDLVGSPLSSPFHRQHATAGLDGTLHHFEQAVAWVAANTPNDTETLRIEALVTYWPNGRGPFHVVFSSPDRTGAAP